MGSLLHAVQHFRLLVIALAIGVLGLGVVQLRGAPLDVLPEFTPPYVEIQTEALGLSADEVEQLITVPLEADLLNGVEGAEIIRSESLPGISSIVMVFEQGTNIYRARQLVEERLTQAHALPNVSKPPTLLAPLSSSNRVLMIGMSSDTVSAIEQSVIARWTVRPRLMGIPGVANVAIWGMRDQQLQVQVDPERLQAAGVTLSQVIQSAGNAQVVSPLSFLEASTPGTGGFIETPQQRLQVRHIIEKIADPAELGKVPVAGTGGRLTLSDVATISIDHQPLIGDAIVKGGPGLVLVVEKFPGASTIDVTKNVEAALVKMGAGLEGIETDTTLFRPATYLESASSNVIRTVGIGLVLMLLVLAAMRFNWRALIIAAITVPLSIVAAAVTLVALGQGMNALIFLGLAAAIALVVDEAVALSARLTQRLRAHRENGGPRPIATVVREVGEDIRGPLTYAGLVSLLAIVPVAVLGGRPGGFFAPFVAAYAVAVVAATVVALFVAPALAILLFRGWEPSAPSALSQRLQGGYANSLKRFSGRLWTPVLAGGLAILVGAVALPLFGGSVLPKFQDRSVLVRLDGEIGTSNPAMTAAATELTKRLEGLTGVESVSAHVGRAITGDRVTNVNSSDVWVSVKEDADYDQTIADIRAAVEGTQGVQHQVVTYTDQMVRNVGALRGGENTVTSNGLDVLTGAKHDLVVRVYGQDQAVLEQEAARVLDLVTGVDGVTDPIVDSAEKQPTIEIEPDLEKAQQFGLTPGDVRRAAATLLQGIQVGSVFQEQKVFDVLVQGSASTRESVEDVRNLLIDRPGGHVRLGQVAEVRVAEIPSAIKREAVSRRIDIVAGVSGRSVSAVAADIESALSQTSFPLEYHAEVLQESTSDEIGTGYVAGFALAALIAAFLLLQAAVNSWRLALVIFAALPAALVGGLVGALVGGGAFSLGAWVGFLAVLALATRTSILFVVRAQTLERELADWPRSAVAQQAARDRLVPVVATAAALTALIAPFAFLGSGPGLELLHPMAVVLLGGLVTSTLVTLFVLPALYQHVPHRPVAGKPGDGEARYRQVFPGSRETAADGDRQSVPAAAAQTGDML